MRPTLAAIACLVVVGGCTSSGGGDDERSPSSSAGSTSPSASGPASSSPSASTSTSTSASASAAGGLPAAMAIHGVTYRAEPNRTHVNTTVVYDAAPPVGGNHSPYWANCTGTIYDHQIANENAVHMLEHGAVWITYNPATIGAAGLASLKSLVAGQDHLALSPYAGLKTPISLQAWSYQLFLSDAADPRIAQFIATLRSNAEVTPEMGASCSDPYFDPARSTPGHPQVDS